MIRHKGRRLGTVGVVPLLEPRIERLATQLRKLISANALEGNLHLSSRHEQNEIRQEKKSALKQSSAEGGRFSSKGIAEAAAPHAARPDQNDRGFRNSSEDVGRRSRAAQVFLAVALGMPRRPRQIILSPAKSRDYLVNRLLGSHPDFGAGLAQVRYSHRPDHSQAGIKNGIKEHPLPKQRSKS